MTVSNVRQLRRAVADPSIDVIEMDPRKTYRIRKPIAVRSGKAIDGKESRFGIDAGPRTHPVRFTDDEREAEIIEIGVAPTPEPAP